MGKALEQGRILFWCCGRHFQPFHAGAGIRQRHAGEKTEPCRRRIHRRQAQRIGRALGHHQGRALPAVMRNGAAKPVGRQKRKPQGEKQAFCRPVLVHQIQGFHCSIP